MPSEGGGDEPLRSRDELHDYWTDPGDEIDQPENHIDLEATSRFLIEFIARYTDETASILELGCNVGRNLHYLYEAGYRNLGGVDINGDALALLGETYPELASAVDVHEAAVEEFLVDLPDDAVDLTFTMAVLAHIHPNDAFVFDEMVRTTAAYLVTFENEETRSYKQVARNYGDVFTERGCQLVQTVDGRTIADQTDQRAAYRLRVFET